MVFITLIPTHRNDGSPVGQAERQEILSSLWQRFGGLTIEGTVEGHWIDAEDGQHYQDACLKVMVACQPDDLADAENAVREIGRRLGQIEMLFEVRYFDGVRFLRIEPEAD